LKDENAIGKEGYHQQNEWRYPWRKPLFHFFLKLEV
jgi:hypothetical protein